MAVFASINQFDEFREIVENLNLLFFSCKQKINKLNYEEIILKTKCFVRITFISIRFVHSEESSFTHRFHAHSLSSTFELMASIRFGWALVDGGQQQQEPTQIFRFSKSIEWSSQKAQWFVHDEDSLSFEASRNWHHPSRTHWFIVSTQNYVKLSQIRSFIFTKSLTSYSLHFRMRTLFRLGLTSKRTESSNGNAFARVSYR